jgi:hypothetical protein
MVHAEEFDLDVVGDILFVEEVLVFGLAEAQVEFLLL